MSNITRRSKSAIVAAAILSFCLAAAGCGSSAAPAETTAAETTAATTTAAETTTTTAETTTAETTTTTAAETTEAETTTEAAEEESGEDFSLLDVTSDMITVGLYATGENNEELVFSMFNAPSGTPMCSLFMFEEGGKNGDVICGAYTAETETDEDGIAYTILTFDDVYTGNESQIGFAEYQDEEGNYLGYIIDGAGNTYEATLLDADETINYMGSAVAFIRGDITTDDLTASSDLDELKAAFAYAYVGADEEGTEMYWLVNDNVTFGWLFLVSADGTQAVNAIGKIIAEDDGTVTITDNETGVSINVAIEESVDDEGDAYILLKTTDTGDIAALYPMDSDTVIDALAVMANS